jgi:putative phosphoribosyl transferase
MPALSAFLPISTTPTVDGAKHELIPLSQATRESECDTRRASPRPGQKQGDVQVPRAVADGRSTERDARLNGVVRLASKEEYTMSETKTLTSSERPVSIPANSTRLEGILGLPSPARGGVLFAHGSGSGRFSPRNNFVAGVLQQAGFATLLLDLLDEREAADRRNVFDIDLLADRCSIAAAWLGEQPEIRGLRLGYFGASTGAGAALQAAARSPEGIAAVVSRGGRPDLAAAYLPAVQAPTLLIVGSHDYPVIGMNEEALALLRCPKELVLVRGATHLFEEPGTLEEVARLARDWFGRYLG